MKKEFQKTNIQYKKNIIFLTSIFILNLFSIASFYTQEKDYLTDK